jgi:hypothetical protein
MPTINFESVTGIIVELKRFFKKFVETLRSRFCRKFQHPRIPRDKNSKSSEIHFEDLWRCTEEGHTT